MIFFPDIFERNQERHFYWPDYNIYWIDLDQDDFPIVDSVNTNICRLPITCRTVWHISPHAIVTEFKHKDKIKIIEKVKFQYVEFYLVPFKKEIRVIAFFDMTKNEILSLERSLPGPTAHRRGQVARYHFMMHYSTRQISEALNVEEKLIRKDITAIKAENVDAFKSDMKGHKKLLGHMTEIDEAIVYHEKILWEKYLTHETESQYLSRQMAQAQAVNSRDDYKEFYELKCNTTALQGAILKQIGDLRKQRVDLWDKFGLTGKDAMEHLFADGKDVNARAEEFRTLVYTVIGGVKAEINDPELVKRICERVRSEVNKNVHYDRTGGDKASQQPIDAEFTEA